MSPLLASKRAVTSKVCPCSRPSGSVRGRLSRAWIAANRAWWDRMIKAFLLGMGTGPRVGVKSRRAARHGVAGPAPGGGWAGPSGTLVPGLDLERVVLVRGAQVGERAHLAQLVAAGELAVGLRRVGVGLDGQGLGVRGLDQLQL